MILFVGDKPSAKMKPGARPFEGAACEKRVREWILSLMSSDPFYLVINRTDENLLHYLSSAVIYKHPIVSFGNIAYNRLRKLGYESFKLPHPSGRNRQINNKKFINQKLKECKQWLNSQQS